MRPIPKTLLTSSCTVRTPVEGPGGHPGYSEPRRISNVRYERARGLSASSPYRRQGAGGGTLYIDARSSAGAFEVPAGSLVSVDGAACEACAESTERFEGPGGRVHHWEVTLS